MKHRYTIYMSIVQTFNTQSFRKGTERIERIFIWDVVTRFSTSDFIMIQLLPIRLFRQVQKLFWHFETERKLNHEKPKSQKMLRQKAGRSCEPFSFMIPKNMCNSFAVFLVFYISIWINLVCQAYEELYEVSVPPLSSQ